MALGTVRVRGLRETERAFRRASRELRSELRKELRDAGGIVADEARSLLAPLSSHSASGIRPRVRAGGRVVVEQTRRRVTGKRPDWGIRQMEDVFLPALEKKGDEVEDQLEQMLDRLGADKGF